MPTSPRTYSGDHFALTLSGNNAGFLKSLDGGTASADVITETHPTSYFAKKHIAGIKYEDFTAQLDLSLEKPIYDWISDTWVGKHVRKDGSITAYDSAFKPLYEQQFFHALLTEVTIPPLDGTSKDAAYLTVKFQPEMTRLVPSKALKPNVKKNTKIWQASNFSLNIPGLDCKKVAKIDGFTIKQTIQENPIGDRRDYQKEPGVIEFPNLRVVFPETSIQSWHDWFESFVIKGNNGDDNQKSGELVFLTPDNKTELARVNFFGLGIFRLAQDKSAANNDQMKYAAAELYCERMEFVYGKPVSA